MISKPNKPGYICSALTELPADEVQEAKVFFSAIADRLGQVLGLRPWVPHEHFDPIAHAEFTPAQVKMAEKEIVCEKTGFLLVIAMRPSWGGGIEIGWAEDRGIPVLTLCPQAKLDQRKISRLLRGCSTKVAGFCDYEDALDVAEAVVREQFEIDK